MIKITLILQFAGFGSKKAVADEQKKAVRRTKDSRTKAQMVRPVKKVRGHVGKYFEHFYIKFHSIQVVMTWEDSH